MPVNIINRADAEAIIREQVARAGCIHNFSGCTEKFCSHEHGA